MRYKTDCVALFRPPREPCHGVSVDQEQHAVPLDQEQSERARGIGGRLPGSRHKR